MTRRCTALLAAVFLAACTEPLVPSRAQTYPFTGPAGEIFHWPQERIPVRFYADPRGPMPQLLSEATRAWEDQFLYGEFRAALVTDSTKADVLVRWSDSVPPAAPIDPGPPVKACSGLTQAFTDTSGTRLDGPVRTELSVLTGTVFTPEQVIACMRRTLTHELGHVLGLFRESPDTLDVMYAPPRVSSPGSGDRNTVEKLYHTPPTLGPPLIP